MCGIAGIVSSSDRPDARLVRRMCDRMVHRGPDGSGFHENGQSALGMRRLAIIDVAGSQQPVYNEDRTVAAVFNGEIYNFAELRERLRARGHSLTTNGDTECLVHLYEDYGEDLVHRLRGMFAFAIWDARAKRLLLARDRVGKKPLYWREDGDSLAFGSELKALLADPDLAPGLDLVALHHYLTYQYVPAPWSIYEGIKKLPPGHLLSWQDGVAKVSRYWRLDCTERPVGSVPEEAERLRSLLLDATKVRMLSERPLGAFLSGGLDSSAVVAAMARQTSQPVKTFSIGFEERRFDEREPARRLAEYYGTDHQEFVVTPAATDVLPMLAWHFDEPFADASAIPSFYVARMSSQHVTVVLTGDGGDESFGGYQRYVVMGMAGRVPVPQFTRRPLRSLGSSIVRRGGSGALARFGRAAVMLAEPVPRRYARRMSYFAPEQKLALYSDALREQLAGVDSYELLCQAFEESRARSGVCRLMDVDVQTYLPGDLLPKVDITTMSCSLEARSPFLDHNLMEWAAGLPGRLKVRSRTTKYLLKHAIEPWLPSELITRQKQGFGVPLASWLRAELRDLSWDMLTDSTAKSRGLFRPEAVASLLSEHAQGINHSTRIWALIQFELWHRNFIDARAVSDQVPFPSA
jgi:asparagine synthase (glutamine-hydrolysing)